jgi:aminobenzoyl-glutamate transport protein
MVRNFTGFPPLGMVMVALLGIGVAETSGLIRAAINAMLVKTPAKLVTSMVIFTGIISSIGSDMGYVLVIPLAGAIFHSLGRNPLVGMAAAFAGVSAGFSANIIITPLDPMLAGLTTAAAQGFDVNYHEVSVLANYFFLATATFILCIVGTIVTTKWVEPNLGKYSGDAEHETITKLNTMKLLNVSRGTPQKQEYLTNGARN